jgi:hypothetical protein
VCQKWTSDLGGFVSYARVGRGGRAVGGYPQIPLHRIRTMHSFGLGFRGGESAMKISCLLLVNSAGLGLSGWKVVFCISREVGYSDGSNDGGFRQYSSSGLLFDGNE